MTNDKANRDGAPTPGDDPAARAGTAPGWVPKDGEAEPATMAAASLGGAAAHRPGRAAPGSMPAPGAEPAVEREDGDQG